ncbi:MAG: hypothetical protein AAF429_09275 [Pseudomonadota bacterium]
MTRYWRLGFLAGFLLLGGVLYSAPSAERTPAEIADLEGGDMDELHQP